MIENEKKIVVDVRIGGSKSGFGRENSFKVPICEFS
jgi:hypothetical protein